MATNPMQRKARSSFLLGFFIAILIMGLVAGFLAYQLITEKQEQAELEKNSVSVCVLNKDIASGTTITVDDYTFITMPSSIVPNDYVKISELLIEAENANSKNTDSKIEYIAKVDLKEKTPLTTSTIVKKEEAINKDVRTQEYNMITLPTKLSKGDYIDIRLSLPSGEDYIVVSKKKVEDANEDTIWINMTEEQTLVLSNAIIEHYIMAGSKLYATIYVEPGNQEDLTPTYVPNNQVKDLLELENATGDATLSNDIYGEGQNGKYLSEREKINQIIQQYSDTRQANIEQGISDEISRMQQSREEYFTSLNGAVQ